MHNKNIWRQNANRLIVEMTQSLPYLRCCCDWVLSSFIIWAKLSVLWNSAMLYVGEIKVFPLVLDFLLQCPTKKKSVMACTWTLNTHGSRHSFHLGEPKLLVNSLHRTMLKYWVSQGARDIALLLPQILKFVFVWCWPLMWPLTTFHYTNTSTLL